MAPARFTHHCSGLLALLTCLLAGFMAVLWLPATPAVAAEPPDEAKLLRALLVGDTGDPDIGASVRADLGTMRRLLEGAFRDHKDRLQIEVLQDRNVTRDRILGYYSKLQNVPEESLLFYFSGHGGTERHRGHLFQVLAADSDRPTPLFRDEVRAAMQSRGPRLSILLSDVCSNFMDIGPFPRGTPPRSAWETARCLFLQARGLVDINAVTEGEAAVGLDDGGFFTRSLDELLTQPLKKLDLNGDGFLHWQELLPALQEMTHRKYAGWRNQVLPAVKGELARAQTKPQQEELTRYKNQLEKQDSQTVRAYSLPPLARFGVRVVLAKDGEGVQVLLVEEFTPASLTGLKAGDVILSIGGRDTNSLRDFTEAVAQAKGTVEVKYRRGEDDVTSVKVRLAAWRAPGAES